MNINMDIPGLQGFSGRSLPISLLFLALTSVAASGCRTGGDDLSGTAGMMKPMSIGGTVYGQGEAGEPGSGSQAAVAGAQVELWRDMDDDGTCDRSVATVGADEKGDYLFERLEEGTYCVGASADGATAVNADALSMPIELGAAASQGQTVDIDAR